MTLIKSNFLKLAGTYIAEHFKFNQCGSLYKGEMRKRVKGILKPKSRLGTIGEVGANSSVSETQSLISLQMSMNSSKLAGKTEVQERHGYGINKWKSGAVY